MPLSKENPVPVFFPAVCRETAAAGADTEACAGADSKSASDSGRAPALPPSAMPMYINTAASEALVISRFHVILIFSLLQFM
jgi:hypothetical protein